VAAGSATVRTERQSRSATRPAAGRPGTAGPGVRAGPAGRGPLARIRLLAPIRLLDRPLTSYYLVLGATLLLTMLGLVMVLSASSIRGLRWFSDSFYFVDKQAIWVGIGLPILWVASRLPVRAYRALAYPLLLGTLGLLVLVAVPGLGHEVNGNRNWLVLTDSIRIQPAEFAKLALVIWGADLIARKQSLKLLGRVRHLFVPLVPAVLVIVGLVLIGGDLGTAVILVAVLLALLWFAGTPIRFFALLVTGTALAATYFATIDGERVSRLTAFRDPFADMLDTGYQAGQGLYALASGGVFGVGLGASRQKWGALPEPHTDFIFAIIGEELGLVGTLVVLALVVTLAYGGMRIALRTSDPFVRLAAAGITSWLMVQSVVNIGAVLGLLPIAGLPLPLVSYGGSALLPTLFGLGMLLSFARAEPDARAALAARRPGRLRRLAGRLRGARAG